MATAKRFVLIPGAWMGAWAWEGVLPALRARGYRADALTLSGLTDDADVSTIGLTTHVEEVVALLEGADMREVVLVGHSYSGIVAGLVADRVPERIAHSVLIAAFLPQNGKSLLDAFPPPQRADERRQIAAHGGRWPAPDAEGLADERDLSPAQRQHLKERLRAHPGRTVSEPAHLARPLSEQRATYIVCTLEQGDSLSDDITALRGEATWDFRSLEAGHFPMISTPDALAAMLVEIAERADTAAP